MCIHFPSRLSLKGVRRPPYQFSNEVNRGNDETFLSNRENDGTFLSRNNGYVLALLRTYLRLREPQIQYGLSVPSLKDAPANYHRSFATNVHIP